LLLSAKTNTSALNLADTGTPAASTANTTTTTNDPVGSQEAEDDLISGAIDMDTVNESETADTLETK
jgi:hypothetical protein